MKDSNIILKYRTLFGKKEILIPVEKSKLIIRYDNFTRSKYFILELYFKDSLVFKQFEEANWGKINFLNTVNRLLSSNHMKFNNDFIKEQTFTIATLSEYLNKFVKIELLPL